MRRLLKYQIDFRLILAALFGTWCQGDEVRVVDRRPHETVLEWTETVVQADGTKKSETRSYVEIATGLNRWNGTEWVAADPSFEMARGYGVLRNVQHRTVTAPSTMNAEGLLDMELPNGGRLVMHTAGLAVTDGARSFWIGEVQDSRGELMSPTELVFHDAFSGIKADIVVRSELSGIECDVVLRERITAETVRAYGIDPRDARLEVWHEVLQAPEGRSEDRVIRRVDGSKDSDADIFIGGMKFGRGRAFLTGVADQSGSKVEDGLEVAKAWVNIGGIDWLIESLPFAEVAEELEALPAPVEARSISREEVGRAFAEVYERNKKGMPVRLGEVERLKNENSRQMDKKASGLAVSTKKINRILSESKRRELFAEAPNGQRFSSEGRTALASRSSPGLVWDYILLNATQTNYVFRGSTTYYNSTNKIDLFGTTVIEGGCVVKMGPYTSGATFPAIRVWGGLDCRTRSGLPALFTARDDDTVGELLPSSTGTVSGRYGYAHLMFYSGAGDTIYVHDVQSRYAAVGIGFGNGRVGTNLVSNVQILESNRAIESGWSDVWVRNALILDSSIALNGGGSGNRTFHVEHLTTANVDYLFYFEGAYTFALNLTNSLISSAPLQNWAPVNTNAVAVVNSTAYKTAGRGSYYLADGSSYRNAGTTNISTATQALLRKTTSYAPIEVTSAIASETVWGPVAQRDTDAPDLGYHYTPLDYLVSGVTVSAPFTLTNGVVVGIYGSEGFVIGSGGKLVSQGRPAELNRITRHQTVQEQPAAFGSAASRLVRLSATDREVRLTQTEVAVMAGSDTSRTFISPFAGGSHMLTPLALKDCHFFNVNQDFYLASGTNTVLAFTNNVFQNCKIQFAQGQVNIFTTYSPFTLNLWNNLFEGGTNIFSYMTNSSTWTIKDNAFNSGVLTLTGGSYTPAAGNNAYRSGLTSLGGSANQTIGAFEFKHGTYGEFYYPTNGAMTNLLNAGSRSATNAGLFHYSVHGGIKETNSTVDIGFHYLAWEPGEALSGDDEDMDGLPDYLEDRDGDGIVDPGETDWASYDSANGLSGGTGLMLFTPLR